MTMDEKNWRNFAAYIIEHGRRYESQRLFSRFVKSEIGEICMALAGLPINDSMKEKLIRKNINISNVKREYLYDIGRMCRKSEITFGSLEVLIRRTFLCFDLGTFLKALDFIGHSDWREHHRYKLIKYPHSLINVILDAYSFVCAPPSKEKNPRYLWILEKKSFTKTELQKDLQLSRSKANNLIGAFRVKYGSTSLTFNDGVYIVNKEIKGKIGELSPKLEE